MIDANNLETSGLLNTIDPISLSMSDKINIIKEKTINKDNFKKILTISHDTKPIQEWYNPNHLLYAYPTLFPYGVGGLMDSRRDKKLTYRDHVNYLMKLRCDRFRTQEFFICCF